MLLRTLLSINVSISRKDAVCGCPTGFETDSFFGGPGQKSIGFSE